MTDHLRVAHELTGYWDRHLTGQDRGLILAQSHAACSIAESLAVLADALGPQITTDTAHTEVVGWYCEPDPDCIDPDHKRFSIYEPDCGHGTPMSIEIHGGVEAAAAAMAEAVDAAVINPADEVQS